jgi:hypothetical protein
MKYLTVHSAYTWEGEAGERVAGAGEAEVGVGHTGDQEAGAWKDEV